MNIEDIKDVEAIDVKDKIVILKTDDVEVSIVKEMRELMFEKGCLGIIVLPPDTVVETLGLSELEGLVSGIKARTSQKDASEISGK